MKTFFGLIAVLLLIMGCDDGDMTFKTFDFSTASKESCLDNNIIFKFKDTEALILELSPTALIDSSTIDPATGNHIPRLVPIGGGANNGFITYRNYTGTVTKETLCNEIPPAFPSVIDEWKGEGQLSIITTEDRQDGKLKGFIHQITLKNVTFTKGGETITINDNIFGFVKSDLDIVFEFIPQGAVVPLVESCDNGLIYTRKNNEALILSLPNGTLPTTVDTKTITLETENQILIVFKVFENAVSPNNICNPIITPVVKQHWTVESGKMIIKTTAGEGDKLIHEIRLKDVVFENSKGEKFKISDITAPAPDGYLFGTYYP